MFHKRLLVVICLLLPSLLSSSTCDDMQQRCLLPNVKNTMSQAICDWLRQNQQELEQQKQNGQNCVPSKTDVETRKPRRQRNDIAFWVRQTMQELDQYQQENIEKTCIKEFLEINNDLEKQWQNSFSGKRSMTDKQCVGFYSIVQIEQFQQYGFVHKK